MLSPAHRLLFLFLLAGFPLGCASGGKVTPPTEELLTLPKEMADRFELQAAAITPAEPASAPIAPALLPSSRKSSPKKKAASIAAAQAVQYPDLRKDLQTQFKTGEKAVYEITYFGVPAAYFTMTVQPPQTINGRAVYHSAITVESHPLFKLVYRMNDRIDTFFDQMGLFSHRFQMSLDESKQTRQTLELYDHEQGRMFYRNFWAPRDNTPKRHEGYFPMPRFAQDSVSSLYYLRAIPLRLNDQFEFEVAQEGKHFQSIIKVEGTEKLSSKIGDKQALKLRLGARINGQLKKPDDNFLWISLDETRIPLRLEAKVKIGTIVATLVKYEPGKAE
jgi:hypothetical protein